MQTSFKCRLTRPEFVIPQSFARSVCESLLWRIYQNRITDVTQLPSGSFHCQYIVPFDIQTCSLITTVGSVISISIFCNQRQTERPVLMGKGESWSPSRFQSAPVSQPG